MFLYQSSSGAFLGALAIMKCGLYSDSVACYQKQLEATAIRKPLPITLDELRFLNRYVPALSDCHNVAHTVAGAVVRRGDAPWYTLIPQRPEDYLCSNGFLYGLVLAAYESGALTETMVLAPEVLHACDGRNFSGEHECEQSDCFHGIGQMFSIATKNNLIQSLRWCDTMTSTLPDKEKEWSTRTCQLGVFKNVFMWDEAIPKPPRPLPQSDVKPLREALPKLQWRDMCMRSSWPLFIDDMKDAKGVDRFCSYANTTTEREACRGRAYRSIAFVRGNDVKSIRTYCLSQPEQWRALCLESAAIDRQQKNEPVRGIRIALEICGTQTDAYATSCSQAIARGVRSMFFDNKTRLTYCNYIPKEHQPLCGNLP